MKEKSHTVILGLGSNLGDRAGYLRYALQHIPHIINQSQVYETKPMGGPEGQPSFYNMVIAIETCLTPSEIHKCCQEVEKGAGRERLIRWGPRTLDVDILFYDDLQLQTPTLTIPHPRISERSFVIIPLAEIAPEKIMGPWKLLLKNNDVSCLGPLSKIKVC